MPDRSRAGIYLEAFILRANVSQQSHCAWFPLVGENHRPMPDM